MIIWLWETSIWFENWVISTCTHFSTKIIYSLKGDPIFNSDKLKNMRHPQIKPVCSKNINTITVTSLCNVLSAYSLRENNPFYIQQDRKYSDPKACNSKTTLEDKLMHGLKKKPSRDLQGPPETSKNFKDNNLDKSRQKSATPIMALRSCIVRKWMASLKKPVKSGIMGINTVFIGDSL